MYSTTEKLHAQIYSLSAAVLGLLCLTPFTTLRADDGSNAADDFSGCPNLQVPEGNLVKFHAFAVGVQIYRWNGSAWAFVAPAAQLYADPGHHGLVGIHYAGPTWESKSGSKVVGSRIAACSQGPNSIPWLLLGAVSSQGPGVFNHVTFVQRVNTNGGVAPSLPGTTVGQLVEVPYKAEYYFYEAAE